MPLPDSPIRILLVEDSEDDVFFFKRSLSRAAIPNELHIARDGAKAIEYLSGNPPMPAVIFLDLKMPNQNGFEVLEWLKNNPALKATKVFILTSSGEPHERQRALKLGADAYLIKPLPADRLQQLLRSES